MDGSSVTSAATRRRFLCGTMSRFWSIPAPAAAPTERSDRQRNDMAFWAQPKAPHFPARRCTYRKSPYRIRDRVICLCMETIIRKGASACGGDPGQFPAGSRQKRCKTCKVSPDDGSAFRWRPVHIGRTWFVRCPKYQQSAAG